MDKKISVEVKCLFCEAALKHEEGVEYKSGDLIECSNCGELNDYDAVLDVAKEKGIEITRSEVKKDVEKTLKNIFKNF